MILFRSAALVIVCGAVMLVHWTRASSSTPSGATGAKATAQDGQYIVRMLDLFGGQYWARVAGLDSGQPPRVNGHDEFAARWIQEIRRSLHGLPATVVHQQFSTPGFAGMPATRPGTNIIVIVPGSQHPDQAVVVGSHYDGEPTSQGSAYDDTSGSVVTLALARVLGAAWRAHGLPSRSVEFVLFDGEEQGLVGSTAFSFALRHGALMPQPVFMIDEEQSGIGYPVRPFGLLSRSPAPSIAASTGKLAPLAVRIVGPITPPDPKALVLALRRITAARSQVFTTLHSTYGHISYRGGDASAFARSDTPYLQIGPDIPICCSDNAPFEALGLPTVTLSGDFHYYERDHPSWAFPYDQPQDTPQAMACDSGGSPRPTIALHAALSLELLMSRALVDDYAPATHGMGMTIFSTAPGSHTVVRFQIVGAGKGDWTFGDGATASGTSVTHSYQNAGSYVVRVHINKTQTISSRLTVPKDQPVFSSTVILHPPRIIPWRPPELQAIAGCH